MGSNVGGDDHGKMALAIESDDLEVEEYGLDIKLDAELEDILTRAEVGQSAQLTQGSAAHQGSSDQALNPAQTTDDDVEVMDIEDVVDIRPLPPIEQFRTKGYLSVSDLVGTVWCEVQYDYRLRSSPYLPLDKRPQNITSKDGAVIPMDKIKVEGKEKVLKRGQKIHKRLEREIHPEEIIVKATTREDVWGLRFLNMFSALEALLTIGKCRELPVVGFVRGILVMGIIDEITREAMTEKSNGPKTRSGADDKSQTSLTSFFSPTKQPTTPKPAPRTHKLYVSDSKTRASGTVPRDEDTLAGRLQVMLYKELLDAMLLSSESKQEDDALAGREDTILPTETPFIWAVLFAHLGVEMDEPLSESFIIQSRPIIVGNNLRFGIDQARTLSDMVKIWRQYVVALGLGTPIKKLPGSKASSKSVKSESEAGKTENKLQLVYRRAGAKERKKRLSTGKRRRGKRKASNGEDMRPEKEEDDTDVDEDAAVQRAIAESLKVINNGENTADHVVISQQSGVQTAEISSTQDADGFEPSAEEDELAWAVEMSLGGDKDILKGEDEGEIILRTSQQHPDSPGFSSHSSPSPTPMTPPSQPGTQPQISTTAETRSSSSAGTIIGRTVFSHSPRLLATHLASVLQWWMGEREAIGVSLGETRRCGWCEFEEGCEWRAKKAAEALEKVQLSRQMSVDQR